MLFRLSIRQHNRQALQKRSAILMLIVSLALLCIMQAGAKALPQDGAQPSRLAQIHAAMETFREGKKLVAEERWVSAAEKFNRAIELYPKGDPADAALYWLAFSLKEQGKLQEAKKALIRLFDEFPNSTWINDATAMRLEVASQLGEKDVVIRIVRNESKPSDEVQIAAMQGFFKTDPARALEMVDRALKNDSGASARLKESAITLLGMQSSKHATERLIEVARHEPDVKLRRKAIYWLGRTSDAAALNLLRELAANSNKEISEAALSALSMSKKSDAWLVIKDGGRQMEFSKNRIIKMDGAGKLDFKDDGRLVEIPRELTIKVNGVAIYEKRVVHEGEEVRIVDENNQTIWTLSLETNERAAMFDDTLLGGQFTFSLDAPETYLLQSTSDGIRMNALPAAISFGIKTDSVEGALAAQLGLKSGTAMVVTETSAGVLTVPGGLQKFDVITHVDGKAPAGEGEMWPAIYKKSQDAATDKLSLRIIRNREAFEVIYTIQQTAAGQAWRAEMRPASSIASFSGNNGASPDDASDALQPSYQISAGAEPKLIFLNANGELFIRSRKGVFDAMINGVLVPAGRLVRQGNIMRVTGAGGETLFVVGILPNGSLIYTPALDPFTARGRLGLKTDGISSALAAQLGIKPEQVLSVTGVVEGMPAALSGLKGSDLIFGIDGQSLGGTVTLDQTIFIKKPGDKLKLLILRNGQFQDINIEIRDEPRWQDFTALEKRYLEVNRKLESLVK